MGKYTIIADISNKLLDILSENIVPDLVSDRNMLGFCSPEEKGDYIVGIYLYDISRDNEMAKAGMINFGMHEQKYPPSVISLQYMITAYSKSDLKFKFIDEQKILGKIIQSLDNENLLSGEEFGNNSYNANIRIEMLHLSIDEKIRIWGDTTKAYKPSIFIRVAPIEIESKKVQTITRVKEFGIDFVETEN